jgi:GNAT superfamily N-acetyltransferase
MPSGDQEIRRAGPSDLEGLLTLIEEFYEQDRHDYLRSRIVGALGPLLSDDSVGQVWVTSSDNTLLGYAIVTWSYSLESGGRDCILDELFVREQSQGHGSALLAHSILQARNAGARSMFLETESHNTRVRELYARHGFQTEDSVWMSAWFDDDA